MRQPTLTHIFDEYRNPNPLPSVVTPELRKVSEHERYSAISEMAYIEACELDSPNSPDFDALMEKIHERIDSELNLVTEKSHITNGRDHDTFYT